MSKLVAFVGSPRTNGFSTKIMNRILEGAQSLDAEIVTYNLNDAGIKGCQGCFYCRTHPNCVTKDTLSSMYNDIATADVVIVSFPLYFGGINGQSKIWLDRMYPMLDENFKPRYPNKKIITIFSQGNSNPNFMSNVIEQTNSFFKLFGWNLVDTFLICDTHNQECTIDQLTLSRAFEVGKAMCLCNTVNE